MTSAIESERLVVSRKRVTDHGEVYTSKREVGAMLDLVASEAERVDARCLEPACGTGNFLSEILRRKLHGVKRLYGSCQCEYEWRAIEAISSLYGIDILSDNVTTCRERLLEILRSEYESVLGGSTPEGVLRAARYILGRNIVWGDALALVRGGAQDEPIVFSEWVSVGEGLIKRRDFLFQSLLTGEDGPEFVSRSEQEQELPTAQPIREYPTTHFLLVDEVA